MLSKNQIKFITSLQLKKFREQYNLFIAEGEKIIQDLLDSGTVCHSLYYTKDSKVWKKEITQFLISEQELSKISQLNTPNKVVGVFEIPFKKEEKLAPVLFCFEDIRDPGNLGTIIRTADWFGMHQIICSKESVDVYNLKVVQSTMGSVSRVGVVYSDLGEMILNLKSQGYVVLGADMKGENLFQKKEFSQKAAFVFGNEGHGLSEPIKKLLDGFICIPKYGQAESLNLAVSAAIVMGTVSKLSS